MITDIGTLNIFYLRNFLNIIQGETRICDLILQGPQSWDNLSMFVDTVAVSGLDSQQQLA